MNNINFFKYNKYFNNDIIWNSIFINMGDIIYILYKKKNLSIRMSQINRMGFSSLLVTYITKFTSFHFKYYKITFNLS